MTITTVKLSGKIEALSEAYRISGMEYPKFHKMDTLSKVGTLATEQIIHLLPPSADAQLLTERTAIILCGREGALDADMRFQSTISNPEEFYPSPSVFVYTLPNIVAGEIALRHGLHGETGFYLLPTFDAQQIAILLQSAFVGSDAEQVIGGWIDYEDNEYMAIVAVINRSNIKDEIINKLDTLWNN